MSVLALLVALLPAAGDSGAEASVAASSLEFAAEADARVHQLSPGANYGAEPVLGADREDAAGYASEVRSYVRFRVAGVTGPVEKATLRLYATDGSGNGPAVHAVDAAWFEGDIDWTSRPSVTSSTVANVETVLPGTWIEVDVTTAVTGDGAYSFALVPESRDGVDMSAREGAHPPELVVTVAEAGDTTPPTVAITSPLLGTTVRSADVLPITAAATDDVGVTKVEFYDNGVWKGTEDTSPFAYSWSVTSADNGTHRWTAKAYDAAGNSGWSPAVDVAVNITGTGTTPGGAVTASAETDPVPNTGDAADDPAVWIHPSDPARSTIIGTDKVGGLAVYDLAGKQLHYYTGIQPNNVELRYGFPLAGQATTIVTASDRRSDAIAAFRVDATTRGLENVAARTLSTGMGVSGLCMYRSAQTGKYYVFVGDSSGTMQQWELYESAGKVDAKKVRTLSVGSTTEGCVADDELGHLYVAEEDVAIWKYGAEPAAGSTRVKVDSAGTGRVRADIEGLSVYYARNGAGYLLASSQGSNDFAVYERRGANAYVGRFKIEPGTIDAVSYTDGIDVTNVALGTSFPDGVFVAQDDRNDSGNQNFKLVPWGKIARALGLTIDTTWDPRMR
jgi:3-phytase